MEKIELKGISKWYGDNNVIKNINLKIFDGEFIVFVGPSGCGKSTLLRLIGGLEECSGGQIIINNLDATSQPPAKRGLSMVFQSYALYPHLTVKENMGFPLKTAGAKKKEIVEKVDHVAKILKLEDLLTRLPKNLSGGQRQRVAIGRSIVRNPTAFLFDEPLSNLDAALRIEMRLEIARLHKNLRATMIYVTHDQVEAMTLADKIVVLEAGEIAQVGTPKELYEKPINLFVAEFIGSPKMNILSYTNQSNIFKSVVSISKIGTNKNLPKFVGIRPEHLNIVGSGKGSFDVIIEVLEYLGADTFIITTHPELGNIVIRSTEDTKLSIGSKIGLKFNQEKMHFFDKHGIRIEKP